VKLECQLAFFFETLKFCAGYDEPSSCGEGYIGLKFDCFSNTCFSNNCLKLENSIQLHIQLALGMLQAIFR